MSSNLLDFSQMGMYEFASHYNVSEFNPAKPWEIPLNSSCLRRVRFNPITENLTCTFNDGTICTYHLVSFGDFYGLVTAPSVGKYFNYYIRNTHSFSYGDESWLGEIGE